MDFAEEFRARVARSIESLGKDRDFIGLSRIWAREAIRHDYAHNFSWLGRPVIQIPQDVYAIQELVWASRPDLIIETGIAHGGSLVTSASMLALLDYCDAATAGTPLHPNESRRKVIGIDIDIRAHNRSAIDAHPLSHKIATVEGSSTSRATFDQVVALADGHERIMVMLDSNHTHDHVLAELEFYAPLVSKQCYCIVWDTGVEDLPDDMCADRPWGPGDNPKTAVWEYMRRLAGEARMGADGAPLEFEYDRSIEHKLTITAAPDGFLRRL
ncbi:cephalosporin hydroxylase family protein [Hyphomicrobium sp.]|uniref:cephalosporin hydroxylase family protein n=1 Tax=Hyphomicrobium sp. TaxID=82 RepID=UPI002CFCE0ED|nr:cephalosporin hydroxylase family protein [Hyphomicrobium sp.]HRN88625.1 cephalosporin hydroxylase family protein [Hyphomicrobium sp.]HRQ25755.1 cephalosporin hydroxylase family protein [Hyphomicrobium sp.]